VCSSSLDIPLSADLSHLANTTGLLRTRGRGRERLPVYSIKKGRGQGLPSRAIRRFRWLKRKVPDSPRPHRCEGEEVNRRKKKGLLRKNDLKCRRLITFTRRLNIVHDPCRG